jgi:hypothetical protein
MMRTSVQLLERVNALPDPQVAYISSDELYIHSGGILWTRMLALSGPANQCRIDLELTLKFDSVANVDAFINNGMAPRHAERNFVYA